MFHFKKRSLIGAALVLSMLGTAATAADWRGWNIHVEGYPNTVAMDKFAELLSEKTNGEITLQMFHGGTLGSQPDAIEQVRLGALEIGNFNLGPIGPIAAEANVVSLPFIFKDVPHMFRVLNGEGGAMIAEGMAAKLAGALMPDIPTVGTTIADVTVKSTNHARLPMFEQFQKVRVRINCTKPSYAAQELDGVLSFRDLSRELMGSHFSQ